MAGAAAKTNIYILRLTGGNYYVGKSSDVVARVNDHFDGTGSAWTARYKPVAIEKIIEGVDSFEEDTWVKRYMSQKGIDKVRGGSYSSPDLDPILIAALKHELKGVKDKCFNCGSTNHFAADCWNKLGSKHISTKCYRCNRQGHYAADCYAKTAVNYYYDSSSDDYSSDNSWD